LSETARGTVPEKFRKRQADVADDTMVPYEPIPAHLQ